MMLRLLLNPQIKKNSRRKKMNLYKMKMNAISDELDIWWLKFLHLLSDLWDPPFTLVLTMIESANCSTFYVQIKFKKKM